MVYFAGKSGNFAGKIRYGYGARLLAKSDEARAGCLIIAHSFLEHKSLFSCWDLSDTGEGGSEGGRGGGRERREGGREGGREGEGREREGEGGSEGGGGEG